MLVKRTSVQKAIGQTQGHGVLTVVAQLVFVKDAAGSLLSNIGDPNSTYRLAPGLESLIQFIPERFVDFLQICQEL